MSEVLRTGWLARPVNVEELAHAVDAALALDVPAYAALGARARSQQRLAEAGRGVYSSLLARDS
jgi:hypothetical protein